MTWMCLRWCYGEPKTLLMLAQIPAMYGFYWAHSFITTIGAINKLSGFLQNYDDWWYLGGFIKFAFLKRPEIYGPCKCFIMRSTNISLQVMLFLSLDEWCNFLRYNNIVQTGWLSVFNMLSKLKRHVYIRDRG